MPRESTPIALADVDAPARPSIVGATATQPAPDVPVGGDPPTKLSAASGVRWSMIGLTGRQLARFGFMLVLARMVGPENFGIVAQAAIFIAFTALLLDQGLGAALIQKPRLASEDIGSVLWMNVVSAVVLGAATIALAPLISAFFSTPELTDVLRALSISVVVLALTVVPQAILARRLRFRALACAEVGGAVVGGTAGIVAVLLGADYWALVVQTVVTDVSVFVGMWLASGRQPVRGSIEAFRELWTFSSRVMGFQMVNYFIRNLDNILIGRFLGATQLAFYALSYRTMLLPIQNLGQVANRVAFPMYARIQDDRSRLRRQYFAGARMLAFASFPLMALVIVAAPVGVPLVFGEEWAAAVVPMQILAVNGMRQSVLTTMGPALLAAGRADWQLRWGLGSSVIIVASIVVGLEWGIVGVAAAYTIAGTLLSPIAVSLVGRLLDFRARDLGRALVPATVATLGLVAAGSAAEVALTQTGASDVVVLVGICATSVIAFLTIVRVGWPGQLSEARDFMRLMVNRPRAA